LVTVTSKKATTINSWLNIISPLEAHPKLPYLGVNLIKVGGVPEIIGTEIIPCEPEPGHTGVGKPRSAANSL